ncbi:AraC family transcriptional regulator [Photobacterium indicum]|uniref:AraC family transcriptional regulator n=1 Tax=Photobacterium indicum TaxID=81447 RepID=UPI003D11757D
MKPDDTVFLIQCETLPFVEIRKASKSAACYQAHSHDEFSLGVIDRGSANYKNLNKRNRIEATNTVTINPGDIHCCNPDADDWSYRMLFIDTHWIGALQSEMLNNYNIDYLPFSNRYEIDPNLYREFNVLFDTLMNEPNPLLSESIFIQYLARYFGQNKIAFPKTEKQASPDIKRVHEKLLDQLESNHTLSDLAKEAGLSRYHLIRQFNTIYGMPPHALQLDERIKKSKVLLKAGNTLTDASGQLGFADQAHFQRHFKKRTAITPKQYQSFFV